MKLMIVESPAKIKKVKACLDSNWIVKSSVGHIRDLPDDKMGFTAPDFKPVYVAMKDKLKIISQLTSVASGADEVYLATDLDREGEAIAWHLEQALGLSNPKRITFNEITKTAIDNALENVRTIDYDLVKAYEARRVLDRIIGYYISPELSEKAKVPLSAGRVQSVCLKIVVFREREIEEFVAESYYDLAIKLDNGINAILDIKAWTDTDHIYDKSIVNELSKTKAVKTTEVSTDPKNDFPRAPFTSSTLQQSAHKVLGFSPKKTMDCAQKLHDLGAITYHRTDSPNLSGDGFEMLRSWLEENDLPFAEKPKKYSSKASAQEAHEAIRPSDINAVDVSEEKDTQALYALITERAIASAMPPAVDSVTICTFESDDDIEVGKYTGKTKFTAKASVVVDNSWRDFVKLEPKETKDTLIPSMPEVGKDYNGKTSILDKKTKAPKRFNEADLVKALERLGIGRPSTYANILENIKSRKYIKVGRAKKDKFISPLPNGIAVVDALEDMSFMNVQYTNITEEYLDKIAKGEGDYKTLVTKVHDTVKSEMDSIKIPVLAITADCPKCNGSMKQLKKRGKDPFWVHLDPSDVEACEQFLPDIEGKPGIKEPTIIASCPGCSNSIKRLKKKSKKTVKNQNAYFWVHEEESHADDCVKFLDDDNGAAVIKEKITDNCPRCEHPIKRLEKRGGKGAFWVHEEESHAKECVKFIEDNNGKPTEKQETST
jgi:DNA topoisomerase-1